MCTPPPNQYEMLEYFNVMDITSSDGKELLLDAYRLSRGDESGLNSSRQVLLAFADIAESSQEASFTRDEITSFWNDSSEPLLFATLLNLEDTEHLSQVVQRIRDKYAQDKYLVYFTLDYCEAIIFLKCNTFHHCAELVFSLDYGSEQKNKMVRRKSLQNLRFWLIPSHCTAWSTVLTSAIQTISQKRGLASISALGCRTRRVC